MTENEWFSKKRTKEEWDDLYSKQIESLLSENWKEFDKLADHKLENEPWDSHEDCWWHGTYSRISIFSNLENFPSCATTISQTKDKELTKEQKRKKKKILKNSIEIRKPPNYFPPNYFYDDDNYIEFSPKHDFIRRQFRFTKEELEEIKRRRLLNLELENMFS